MPVIDEMELPETPDESGEETVLRLMARYNLNRAVCYEMITEVLETFGSSRRSVGIEEALRKMEAKFKSIFEIIINYTDNQSSADEIRAAIKMGAREVGFYYLAGGLKCSGIEVAELADLWKMDKQTLNKMAKTFTARMKLAGHPNQRSAVGCKNMSKARYKQFYRGDAEAQR